MDTTAPRTAFAVDGARVFRTTDAGGTWSEVSGNLASLAGGAFHCIAYNANRPHGYLMVGGDDGVYGSAGPGFRSWTRISTGLPSSPIYDLWFDSADGLLLAATLGRGLWVASGSGAGPAPASNRMGGQQQAPITFPAAAPAAPPLRRPTATPALPQNRSSAGSVAFGPGLVVDSQNGRLFTMNAQGGIAAVDLATGNQMWATSAASKPLTLLGSQLIAQAQPPSTALNSLQIVALDSATGQARAANSATLPPGVTASVGRSPAGVFDAMAEPTNAGAIVSWQFTPNPARGLRPGKTADLETGGSTEPAAAPSRSGKLKLEGFNPLEMQVITPAEQPNPTATPNAGPATAPGPTAEKQLTSADGNVVAVSRPSGRPGDPARYTITVLDPQTGQPLGHFTSPVSVVPFLLTGDHRMAIVQTPGSIQRRPTGETIEEPPSVRAIDLSTGTVVWTRNTPTSTDRLLPP